MPAGIEFDFLSLGDADAIVVTTWGGEGPVRTLVDGGRASHLGQITQFFQTYDIQRLDHVVCTHPHEDHVGGVEELLRTQVVKVGTVWMHDLDVLVNWQFVEGVAALGLQPTVTSALLEIRRRYLSIRDLAAQAGAALRHPFPGTQIGGLVVCGPSNELISTMYAKTRSLDGLAEFEAGRSTRGLHDALLAALGEEFGDDKLGGEPTDPINETSVILGTVVDGLKCLLTGDAGAIGLVDAANAYDLRNVHMLQIPHHGSRRNMTESLLTHLAPNFGVVSCEGSLKHPSRKLVNAIKRTGASVYSTHYPEPGNLRMAFGEAPARADYIAAVPLYEKRG